MIDIHVLPDAAAIGMAGADVLDAAVDDGARVLGFATGSSPDRVYDELVRRHSTSPGPYRDCEIFLLDEYIGLPADHPERYVTVIRRAITDRLGVPPERVHSPEVDDTDDPVAAGARYDAAILAAGGVDIQLLGVGSNGHIAFNEPGAALDGGTHRAVLEERTRRDNARFFGDDIHAVPRAAMTQGIGTILRARRLLLIATGAAKASAIGGLATREPTTSLPVTALHLHADVTVLIDADAAREIDDTRLRSMVRVHRLVARE